MLLRIIKSLITISTSSVRSLFTHLLTSPLFPPSLQQVIKFPDKLWQKKTACQKICHKIWTDPTNFKSSFSSHHFYWKGYRGEFLTRLMSKICLRLINHTKSLNLLLVINLCIIFIQIMYSSRVPLNPYHKLYLFWKPINIP